jgi:hypothetical protein
MSFEAVGSEVVMGVSRHRPYSAEFKLQLVEAYLAGRRDRERARATTRDLRLSACHPRAPGGGTVVNHKRIAPVMRQSALAARARRREALRSQKRPLAPADCPQEAGDSCAPKTEPDKGSICLGVHIFALRALVQLLLFARSARDLRRLRNALGVTTDARTNIVRLEVQAEDPTLAANIAHEFVRDVNDFNGNQRRSQAHERRRFVEEQTTEAQGQLADAEGTLRNFYSANRQFRESPELTYREAQLRRQVDIAQELYLNLRRELEAARIQEVNDAPVLTVIDSAVPSSKRSFPNRRLFVIVGVFLGMVFGVLACVGVDYWQDLMRMQDPTERQLRERLPRVRIRATRRA